jgi:hypothetical protein
MEKKTEYQLSTSVHEGIVEIVMTGEITANAVKKLLNEVFAIIRTHNSKTLLVDVRDIKGRFGFVEAYQRVRNYPPDILSVRTAVVDIPENATFQSLHETTALNAGMSLKWFTDIDTARAWLKSMQR